MPGFDWDRGLWYRIFEQIQDGTADNVMVGLIELFRSVLGIMQDPVPQGISQAKSIESRNGTHTLNHAEAIGLGSQTYRLVNLDE